LHLLLFAEGYRPEKNLAHYRTLQALPLILGPTRKDDAAYLDTCRSKRNIVEYDYVGGITAADAQELIAFAAQLGTDVMAWMKAKHPDLLPEAK